MNAVLNTRRDADQEFVHPPLLEGGMAIGVGWWEMARRISQRGAIGTVALTGNWMILPRRLQDGDPGGHYRRALGAFPHRDMAQEILDKYFLPEGRGGQRHRPVPMLKPRAKHLRDAPLDTELETLLVVSAFAEVWLAKEGHPGLIAVNLLEKVQLPLPAMLYGAMMAGADYVLMGAGLPTQVPALLDQLSDNKPVRYQLTVTGADPKTDDFAVTFDPTRFASPSVRLRRPYFGAIVSIAIAATLVFRRSNPTPDLLIIEGPEAGGHNAPNRSREIGEDGQPVYGPRDVVDLKVIRALGVPFYMAGGWSTPEKLREALALGAAGVQVGSAFAVCRHSRMNAAHRRSVIAMRRSGTLTIFTDPRLSTGEFPFKKVQNVPGTLTDPTVERDRRCDIGALSKLYKRPDGSLGSRCSGDVVALYVKKGGKESDTFGRGCLCNALCAAVDAGQVLPDGSDEPAIVTLGEDLECLDRLLERYGDNFGAEDVVDFVLAT